MDGWIDVEMMVRMDEQINEGMNRQLDGWIS